MSRRADSTKDPRIPVGTQVVSMVQLLFGVEASPQLMCGGSGYRFLFPLGPIHGASQGHALQYEGNVQLAPAADRTRFLEIGDTGARVCPADRYSLLCGAQSALYESDHRYPSDGLLHLLQKEFKRPAIEREALRTKLRESNRFVLELQATLAREQAARTLAEARDADKEKVLGILAHDLLSPLQAILTTTQVLRLRDELGSASMTSLARIASSGERMQKMIEQLRDLVRTRSCSGLRVSKGTEHNLTLLVVKVIHEIRSVNPRCSVRFDEATPRYARVDGDRFEQVASNLIGNAVVHGDTTKPIAVALEAPSEDWISFSVHNYGPAIESDLLSVLFEPFKQSQTRGEYRCTSAGLGLGLYISDSIVRAHGGHMRVTSSPDIGTSVYATLPVR